MRHLATNTSSPKVRELHVHFLWRERAQQMYSLNLPIKTEKSANNVQRKIHTDSKATIKS